MRSYPTTLATSVVAELVRVRASGDNLNSGEFSYGRSSSLPRLHPAMLTILAALALFGLAWAARGESPAPGEAEATPRNNAGQPAAPAASTGGTRAESGVQSLAVVPVPIDRQSYGVMVQIGFDSSASSSAETRRAILEKVRDGMERYVGQSWEVEVNEEQGALFAGPRALARLRAETVGQYAFPEDVQKIYLLALEARGAGFAPSGREWDPLTGRLGPLVHRDPEYDPREIAEGLLALVHELFRPIVSVEQSRSSPPHVRARAGDFSPPDPSWQPMTPERIFEVFYCYLTPEKTIDRVQQVPWTYLGVGDDVDRGLAGFSVTSGLRSAIGPRRRVQTVALGITRRGTGTRLKLMTRPPSRQPLAGVEVEIDSPPLSEGGAGGVASDSIPGSETTETAASDSSPAGNGGPGDVDSDATPLKKGGSGGVGSQAARVPSKLVADRNGVVELSAAAAPTGKPIWLNVRSGQALLARVPFVPGVHDEEVLELGDDTLRLDTEASIALLQAELVDTVARRAVLMSLSRSRANAGKFDEVDELLKELNEMRKAPSFERELNGIRIPAIKAARAARDRTAELRIEKLCTETSELVRNYLDEDKIKEVKEEIEEIRQAAADLAAAEAKFKEGEGVAERFAIDKEPGDDKPKTKKKKKKAAAPRQPPSQPVQGF